MDQRRYAPFVLNCSDQTHSQASERSEGCLPGRPALPLTRQPPGSHLLGGRRLRLVRGRVVCRMTLEPSALVQARVWGNPIRPMRCCVVSLFMGIARPSQGVVSCSSRPARIRSVPPGGSPACHPTTWQRLALTRFPLARRPRPALLRAPCPPRTPRSPPPRRRRPPHCGRLPTRTSHCPRRPRPAPETRQAGSPNDQS